MSNTVERLEKECESVSLAMDYANAIIERGHAETGLAISRHYSPIGAALPTERKRLRDAQAKVERTRNAVRRAMGFDDSERIENV